MPTTMRRAHRDRQRLVRFLHAAAPAVSSVDQAGVVDGEIEDGVVERLGARLGRRRRERGMSITDLAAATGISRSLLSRLESGLRRPTLDVLLVLARVHRVSLDDLVGAPPTGDPRLHPRPSVRHGVTWLPLTQRPGGIQAYKAIIPAGHGQDDPEQRSHEGYEWLYVLDGHLRLHLGHHELVLAAGEVAEFDTRTPHAFANPGDAPTEALMLIGPQGQRAHVRARPARGTAAGAGARPAP